MGYIMDLRAYVGHRPLIQVGSSVFVEDGQGRVLLQLRSDNHQWSYSAAGSMEPGESAEDTARRELLEETKDESLKAALSAWLEGFEDKERTIALSDAVMAALNASPETGEKIEAVQGPGPAGEKEHVDVRRRRLGL